LHLGQFEVSQKANLAGARAQRERYEKLKAALKEEKNVAE